MLPNNLYPFKLHMHPISGRQEGERGGWETRGDGKRMSKRGREGGSAGWWSRGSAVGRVKVWVTWSMRKGLR